MDSRNFEMRRHKKVRKRMAGGKRKQLAPNESGAEPASKKRKKKRNPVRKSLCHTQTLGAGTGERHS